MQVGQFLTKILSNDYGNLRLLHTAEKTDPPPFTECT